MEIGNQIEVILKRISIVLNLITIKIDSMWTIIIL